MFFICLLRKSILGVGGYFYWNTHVIVNNITNVVNIPFTHSWKSCREEVRSEKEVL